MKARLHNFTLGAGTLLDLLPLSQPDPFAMTRRILAQSDAAALYGDWQKVGGDFWKAIRQVEAEIHGNGTGSIKSASSIKNGDSDGSLGI